MKIAKQSGFPKGEALWRGPGAAPLAGESREGGALSGAGVWVEPGAALRPALGVSRCEASGLVERLLAALGMRGRAVEVRFVDDGEIERLNGEFLGLPGPTNVLSFPAGERKGYLGEIALSVDTLMREAVLYGQEPGAHLVRLLAHGLLHLAGYEHGEAMDALTDGAVETVTLFTSIV